MIEKVVKLARPSTSLYDSDSRWGIAGTELRPVPVPIPPRVAAWIRKGALIEVEVEGEVGDGHLDKTGKTEDKVAGSVDKVPEKVDAPPAPVDAPPAPPAPGEGDGDKNEGDAPPAPGEDSGLQQVDPDPKVLEVEAALEELVRSNGLEARVVELANALEAVKAIQDDAERAERLEALGGSIQKLAEELSAPPAPAPALEKTKEKKDAKKAGK